MRGWVDPREKPFIVPGLSGFLKRAHGSISSHGGVALKSERQPISGKRIWLGFHVVRSGVDTGGHRYCSGGFGAAGIRGIHESRMGPYLSRVRRKSPPSMGLYPPGTVLWSSNQSAISQRDWGFPTVQGGVDPRNRNLLPRLMLVLEIWNDLSTGDGTLYPPEVELAQHANHSRSENRPVGLGFPHRAGRYHVSMNYDPLSCPGDAYFVYESCPMSDQIEMTCFNFRRIKLKSEILSCQNRKRCSRVLYLQEVSDLHSRQQAAAFSITFEEFNDEGSHTTVFRAWNNVSTFLNDQATHRVDLGGSDQDDTIIACTLYISEADSVRVSQWLRREHEADMVSQLTGPGCLIELNNHKKRTRHVLLPD